MYSTDVIVWTNKIHERNLTDVMCRWGYPTVATWFWSWNKVPKKRIFKTWLMTHVKGEKERDVLGTMYCMSFQPVVLVSRILYQSYRKGFFTSLLSAFRIYPDTSPGEITGCRELIYNALQDRQKSGSVDYLNSPL